MHPDLNIKKYVGNCATLSALLEVSAYPKPGNIHRLKDFPSTSYEHFLASGVALGPIMGEIAQRSSLSTEWSNICLGKGIKDAVDEMFWWQSGGNTHLGVIMLFTPLSAGAGVCLKKGSIESSMLREYTKEIISKANYTDSLNIYTAIDAAMSQENLGKQDKLDVKNEESREKIIKENINPLQIFEICKNRDSICSEWVTGFKIVFELGYPYLSQRLTEGDNINNATLDTFLKILSENPDSLITRKAGKISANYVSQKAEKIIKKGGTQNEEGLKLLWSLDEELSKENGRLNPGTTADLTAASLYVLLLSGWRL